MSNSWKYLDLQGEGLQSANLKLLRLMKRRHTAYWLWLLAFPFGQHRSYLDDVRGAWSYRLASIAAVVALAAQWLPLAALLLIGLVASALFDLYWIDRRITACNKKLRIQVYLHHGSGAPPGFKGRLVDDAEASFEEYLRTKGAEHPGHNTEPTSTTSRAPAFAEQEALLRELARNQQKPPKV